MLFFCGVLAQFDNARPKAFRFCTRWTTIHLANSVGINEFANNATSPSAWQAKDAPNWIALSLVLKMTSRKSRHFLPFFLPGLFWMSSQLFWKTYYMTSYFSALFLRLVFKACEPFWHRFGIPCKKVTGAHVSKHLGKFCKRFRPTSCTLLCLEHVRNHPAHPNGAG